MKTFILLEIIIINFIVLLFLAAETISFEVFIIIVIMSMFTSAIIIFMYKCTVDIITAIKYETFSSVQLLQKEK